VNCAFILIFFQSTHTGDTFATQRITNLRQTKMKTRLIIVFAVITALALNCSAQNPEKKFGFELSTGASLPTSKLNGTSLKTGLGFEGILHYRFMPYTGIFAGWGWNHFAADETFADNHSDFEETGYVLGLQFKHPAGHSPFSYYLRAAGLYNHIEIENKEGDILKDSGHGFGWQLAGGIDMNLGRNWSLTPGIKFQSLNREIEIESVSTSLNLNYLTFRVGILKQF